MRLINCEAHNVMRVEDVEFDLEGHHLFLVGGRNAQGKSSALQSIVMALCGRSGCDWPDVALREGEDEGWVKLGLSGDEEWHDTEGFTVKLYLKRERSGAVVERFQLLDSAGEPAPEPRTLLKSLYHYRGFDPLEFNRVPKNQQRKMLMDLVGLDFDSGEEKIKEMYGERKVLNRQIKAKQAAFDQIEYHKDAKEEVNTSDLIDELGNVQESNKEFEAKTTALDAEYGKKSEIVEALQELDAKIKELQKRKKDGQKALSDVDKSVKTLSDEVSKLEYVDPKPVKEKIANAGEINQKVAANRARDEKRQELDDLKGRSASLTSAMEDTRAEQQKALQDAQWPLEGLSVDADGVTYNGLPFEQASASQRTVISTRIGMALNPKLRLLICQHGSDLDDDTLAALEEILKGEDFQMLLEVVTHGEEDETRCCVVIEEGRVKEAVS